VWPLVKLLVYVYDMSKRKLYFAGRQQASQAFFLMYQFLLLILIVFSGCVLGL